MPSTHYYIAMGQGLVVDDLTKDQISSSAFSSCSAIIMYNSANNKGGYYHYPANDYTGASAGLLRAMCYLVRPTKVIMGWTPRQMGMANGTGMNDKINVPSLINGYLQAINGTQVELEKGSDTMAAWACAGNLALYNDGEFEFGYATSLRQRIAGRFGTCVLIGQARM